MSDLSGKKVLVVSTNAGVEQDELAVPVEELRAAGAEVTVAAVEAGAVATTSGGEPGTEQSADAAMSDVDDAAYDLLVVPGGTGNSDSLRLDPDAQRIVNAFAASGRPVAAICHAPWLLVETDLVKGRKLTSFKSVRTDTVNAGAEWSDEEVVVDSHGAFTLITSRTPADLEAFVREIKAVLAA